MQIESYDRRPFRVEAIKVTKVNLQEVADWCKGKVKTTPPRKGDNGVGVKYIRVRINRAVTDRQTQAMVGDWVLKTESGFKVYPERAFRNSFVKATPNNAKHALHAIAGAIDKPITAVLEGQRVKIVSVNDSTEENTA